MLGNNLNFPGATTLPTPPRKPLWPLALGFVALIASVGAFASFFMLTEEPPANQDTGCLLNNAPPPASMVVLIDQSDPFSTDDKADIRLRISTWAQSRPRYSQIEIAKINPEHPSEPTTLWRGCTPGRISGLSFVERLTSNATFRQRKWDELMDAPLNEALATLDNDVEAPSSPIIESLLALTRRVGRGDGEKYLVIFSDMLQNTPPSRGGWSVLGPTPTWDAFKSSPLGSRRIRPIPDLTIEAVWIQRFQESRQAGQAAYQTPELRAFWDELFLELGASYPVGSDGYHSGFPPEEG